MADESYKVEAELELRNARGVAADLTKAADAFERFGDQNRNANRALSEAARATRRAERATEEYRRQLARVGQVAGAAYRRIGGTFSRLGTAARMSRASTGHTVRNLVALGATYMGINAVAGAFERLVGATTAANSSVENTILSVASLYTEIERVSFADAQREAAGLYRQLEQLAISSPGTTANLSDMFTMAYGPMRRAGVELNRLTTFSRDAVAVASALRIDAPQVARDISMLMTGVAGTDVRTFRTLRSMGMITESTEEWNEMAQRAPAEAARRLMDIFDRLGRQSAEAFGRTWSGVTSAFSDITQYFMRAISSPAFRVLRDNLRRLNDTLIKFRPGIEKVLTAVGGGIARVFAGVIERMRRAFVWVITNLDTIGARIDSVIATFRRLAPMVRSMLIAGVALKIGAGVLGAVLAGAGAIISTIGGAVSALLPLLAGGGGAGILGMLGIGGGATAAAGGGAAVAGGGALAAIGLPAGVVGILAVAAALEVALGALVTAIGVAAGTVTIIVSVFVALQRQGDRLRGYFEGSGRALVGAVNNFWAALVGIWAAVSPWLETLGFIIVGVVVSGFRILADVLLFLSKVARVVSVVIMLVGRALAPMARVIREVFHDLFTQLRLFSAVLARFIRWLPGATGMVIPSVSLPQGQGGGVSDGIDRWFADFMSALRGSNQPTTEGGGGTGTAPEARPSVNVDMRGARIEVNQEFREADPDRVWVRFRDALEREAVQRVGSGFVPALSR